MVTNDILAGFKRIPDFSYYAISEAGVVINTVNGEYLEFFSSDGGYFKTVLVRDDGKKVLCGRHRLLATTYIPMPETDEPLVVNHKNGIKYDPSS